MCAKAKAAMSVVSSPMYDTTLPSPAPDIHVRPIGHFLRIPSSGTGSQLYDYSAINIITETQAKQANQRHVPYICKVNLAIPSQHAFSALVLYRKMYIFLARLDSAHQRYYLNTPIDQLSICGNIYKYLQTSNPVQFNSTDLAAAY